MAREEVKQEGYSQEDHQVTDNSDPIFIDPFR